MRSLKERKVINWGGKVPNCFYQELRVGNSAYMRLRWMYAWCVCDFVDVVVILWISGACMRDSFFFCFEIS
jgi:hypothetical protein